MSFNLKYIKYKHKYFNLKNQLGGVKCGNPACLKTDLLSLPFSCEKCNKKYCSIECLKDELKQQINDIELEIIQIQEEIENIYKIYGIEHKEGSKFTDSDYVDLYDHYVDKLDEIDEKLLELKTKLVIDSNNKEYQQNYDKKVLERENFKKDIKINMRKKEKLDKAIIEKNRKIIGLLDEIIRFK